MSLIGRQVGPEGTGGGGGAVDFYTPAMMNFDGTTGYYNGIMTTAGNKVTLVARVNLAEKPAGTASQYICRTAGATKQRAALILTDGNNAVTEDRNTISLIIWNSTPSIITRLYSTEGVSMADTLVTIFASYDGDAGVAVLRINGVNEDVSHTSRIAPATATLDAGSGQQYVGSITFNFAGGDMGFVGCRDTYLTNWQDFMDSEGNPKELDESTWTEWGAQPLFWNKHGDMENNLGSAGNMTRNGTVIVGKGGN